MVGFSIPTFFTGTWRSSSSRSGHRPTLVVVTVELRHHARDRRLGQLRLPASADGHADDGAGLYNAAQISRYMRASMLDNLQQDYVRTARAKGMGEGVVVLRHVLRNSLIPVVTVIALNVPASSAARSSPSRSSASTASAIS
jgi:peptide/nickel transport system permease protein